MQDFLEYMRTLQVSQELDRPTQAESANTVSIATIQSLGSPQQIPHYARNHALLQHPWLLSFQNRPLRHTHLEDLPNIVQKLGVLVADHPQLSGLIRETGVSRNLETWLKQRYLISWCFPNWLTAVASKLPTPQTRIPLLKNLYEEHGLSGKPGHSKPHPQMWQQLFEELSAIAPGQSIPLPKSSQDLLPGTQRYLQIYTTACFQYPAAFGLGILAFTESILPYENQLILAGLKKLGISTKGQEFFAVHCDCDQDHAEEILDVIEQTANSPQTLWQVWQGVAMAVRARQGFYDDLDRELVLLRQDTVKSSKG
ncbi:iron-containing redox enzyme family protein [Moorena producens JHB]|uniref:Iron-containing redox enzyme family protein n=1 Tax=Moorena producens (strain JHB) TaxID=1454205 RepID=A0A1D9G308_MOOP1|nr:iron-containing redox enzyme family protein [Moorena producens]AOY81905.1 iron-containing redox enzyme family protein [Moorena producens JHB]